MILVTGSTGGIDRPLIGEGARRGTAVQALVHRVANRSPGADLGLQVHIADLRKSATTDAALAGVDCVFVLSPVDPDLITTENALIVACDRRKVQRIGRALRTAGHPRRAD
jgi:uncharacterized protein YbjT (DUF2867 family)